MLRYGANNRAISSTAATVFWRVAHAAELAPSGVFGPKEAPFRSMEAAFVRRIGRPPGTAYGRRRFGVVRLPRAIQQQPFLESR